MAYSDVVLIYTSYWYLYVANLHRIGIQGWGERRGANNKALLVQSVARLLCDCPLFEDRIETSIRKYHTVNSFPRSSKLTMNKSRAIELRP